MKILKLSIVSSLVAGPFFLSAQPQTEIFGYLETEYDQFQFTDQSYTFGYTKLRIDLEAHPAMEVTVGANMNIQNFFGTTSWNLLDFLPEQIWKPVFQPEGTPDSLWVTELPLLIRDTLYLDNVYLKASFDRFDLTVGKQQISPGVGYAWNPLDIFNRKDLLDPTYEQTGITAIRLEIPVQDRIHIDMVMAPEETWHNSAKMVQGKIGLGRFDLTANYAEYNALFPHWRYGEIEGLQTFRRVEKRFGGSFVGQIWELGVWGEGLFNVGGRSEKDFREIMVGMDHTFDMGTYFLLEIYYNSFGATSEDLSLMDYIYYFGGETHSLMEGYLFAFLNQPLTDFVNLGLFAIANRNDRSAVLNPQLDWNAFENLNISLLYSYYIGEETSEFGLQEGGWRLRLRGYF